ncbi:enoyl-CoA hydratase/isomerase family protein [Nocardioides panzhihuensis]|uniref:enoyl-CoA hydratase/isomerase family protein n=1 Tax=Nocardioides panzhihuensis TaxID=860243 RepID=UPI0015CA2B68|nr:enoyl-CoA hydratase-related protein [Nocardioides panzhihuensis]
MTSPKAPDVPGGDESTVLLERADSGVVTITLNRPDRGNGVVPELVTAFLRILDELEPDFGVRAVVLTGTGKQFSAGADLVDFENHLTHELARSHEPYNARILLPLTQRIANSRLVFLAAVNGAATAGGLDLALACDLRIASERARLGETYINVGMAPGNGGSWFLPRLVGSGVAAELALTGDIVDAQRALEIGLVGRVVPHEELLSVARGLAGRIAAKPWRAIEATKQALQASWQLDLGAAMKASYWTTMSLQHTDDVLEAVRARLEKREPVFNQDIEGD